MKKIICHFLRLSRHGSRRIQHKADVHTAACLKQWVDNKCFTDPDKSLDDVALQIGVSREQLSYYCSRYLGMPFLTWRKKLRMAEAMNIIRENPDMPLYLVGESVGIGNKSNFRTQFKDVAGMTPAEFREKVRK